jgi:hypothetical protein
MPVKDCQGIQFEDPNKPTYSDIFAEDPTWNGKHGKHWKTNLVFLVFKTLDMLSCSIVSS